MAGPTKTNVGDEPTDDGKPNKPMTALGEPDAGQDDAGADAAIAPLVEPTWGKFAAPQECAMCHPNHVREWEMSSHAYAAVDPVFHAMTKVGQRETEGKLGQLCTTCHSPYGVATGQTAIQGSGKDSWQQLDMGPIAQAGVSCDVCHTAVSGLIGNGALNMDPMSGTRYAGISDPMDTLYHASALGALQHTSPFCGSCHQVLKKDPTNDGNMMIEATFAEWNNAGVGADCQQCHMAGYAGPATPGGPLRSLHRHQFVGPDVSLLPEDQFPGSAEQRELARQLMEEQTLHISASYRSRDEVIAISLVNAAGHALPSGATADRQMWVEVIVTDDATGVDAFSSGTLDQNGDLRDENPEHSLEPGTDPQLRVFRQHLTQTDIQGSAREVHFMWQADSFSEDLIGALDSVEVRYDLSALPPGNYHASVRVRFRSLPPYILRYLEKEGGLDPKVKERLPIFEMAGQSFDFAR